MKYLLALLLLCHLISCRDNIIYVPDSPYPMSDDAFVVDTIADGFAIPYGLAIVNDDEYFVTDRIGKFFHFNENKLTEIEGMPEVLTFPIELIPAILHGGLMDVSLHPDYPNEAWVYISYLDKNGFAKVARFQIVDNKATKMETVFTTRTKGYYGNGMRIEWQDDHHFFLNIGGSTTSTNTHPDLIAQDLEEDWGKIHRLQADGGIPVDNPVLAGMTAPSTIWSFGHRDCQGLDYDEVNKVLFGVEHGPKGGDEFNIIEAGGNYGWPIFSYGIDYDGTVVSTITKEEATKTTVLPEHFWTVPTHDGGQAIAPACLLKVDGSNIAAWNDHFLIGSLAYRRLLKYNRATDETYGLSIEGRVRTIEQLPGGDIIVLLERNDLRQSNGKVLRIREK